MGLQMTKEQLETIKLEAGGDIRQAVTSMRLLSLNPPNKRAKIEGEAEGKGKMTTFHIVGKFLYNKRVINNEKPQRLTNI